MSPDEQLPVLVPDRGNTDDLADQVQRIQERNAENDKIEKLRKDRQRWLPDKYYMRAAITFTSATILSWAATAVVVAATAGPGIGRPLGILLAASASLLLCTTLTAGFGWSDYRAHRRTLDEATIRAHDEARRQSEVLKALDALRDDEAAVALLQSASEGLRGLRRAANGRDNVSQFRRPE